MEKSKVFFGGVPTDIDIRRLRDEYPADKLTVGKCIGYDDVARIIGASKDGHRFRTVTSRWRKIVEQTHDIVIGTKAGEGFVVLDDHAKLDLSSSKLRTSRRAARRSLQVAAKIDRKALSEPEQVEFDLNALRAAAITATCQIKKALDLPRL